MAKYPEINEILKPIKILNVHKIKYVVIGGWAVILQGVSRGTQDLDIAICSKNINRLIDKFYENNIKVVHYIDRKTGKINTYDNSETAKKYFLYKKGISIKFYDKKSGFFTDVIDYKDNDFNKIKNNTDTFIIERIKIVTVSKKMLIELKQKSKNKPDREQDIIDIAKLRKLLNEEKNN